MPFAQPGWGDPQQGQGPSELRVQGVLHLRRQLRVEGGEAHPEIWREREESCQGWGRAPGIWQETCSLPGALLWVRGTPHPWVLPTVAVTWGQAVGLSPLMPSFPRLGGKSAQFSIQSAQSCSTPYNESMWALGRDPLHPPCSPPRPYPCLRPGARVAAGSCGGPRCAVSSPPARRWSRGTACRCSGPACAPTRCGCWRRALQGWARREAQRSLGSPRGWEPRAERDLGVEAHAPSPVYTQGTLCAWGDPKAGCRAGCGHCVRLCCSDPLCPSPMHLQSKSGWFPAWPQPGKMGVF